MLFNDYKQAMVRVGFVIGPLDLIDSASGEG
jgi:hypothetical protein